ncbi:MAG: thiol:disulfide interchange protein DsbA/DsbL [Pseudomonadota bacterium]
MRLFQKFLAAFSLGLVVMTASASPASPVAGTDYRVLDKPQQTDSGKKVEVTEFFWYSCPHCNAFEPQLVEWVKKQGNNIVFKRVPIAFRPSFEPQQRLYYTLEAMGKTDELHSKVFHRIHADRQPLDTEAAIVDFIEKQGVDKKKFLEVYNSFGVQTKVRRATQLQQEYKIDGVPTIAIDGRYLTSPSIVGATMGNQPENVLGNATVQVMTWLVNKAAKDQKAQVADPKAATVKVAQAASGTGAKN